MGKQAMAVDDGVKVVHQLVEADLVIDDQEHLTSVSIELITCTNMKVEGLRSRSCQFSRRRSLSPCQRSITKALGRDHIVLTVFAFGGSGGSDATGEKEVGKLHDWFVDCRQTIL
jgi:hypothetical protein